MLMPPPVTEMPVIDLSDLMSRQLLRPHFQPIIDMVQGRVLGHEALIRTLPPAPWRNPDTLFAAARQGGWELALELECLRLSLHVWGSSPQRGWLFVNLSAQALIQALMQVGLKQLLPPNFKADQPLSNVVIEIAGLYRMRDFNLVQEALVLLRKNGGLLALDNFGDDQSSLRQWSELRPELVKIDRYFIRQVHTATHKFQTVRAIQHLAHTLGARLVATGVEEADELMVLRDVGLDMVQGNFIGIPLEQACTDLGPAILAVLDDPKITVLPQERRTSNRGLTARNLLQSAPALPSTATYDEVANLFYHFPEQQAVALVSADNQPIGLMARKTVQDLYLRRFFRDVYGPRHCLFHSNTEPLLIDVNTPVEQLAKVLTSADQRYLHEGYIITEWGRYLGLGTGEQLVRTVTEARIEAARHANPLTFLPGNVPITQHIERLLDNAEPFVACYADLNHFKSFNDHYGYWRGDEMIRLQAECLGNACDPRRDFIGHVGGDDFVLLMQSADWLQRLEAAVEQFNRRALLLFDESARAAGGIMAEDRQGLQRFHPCTTVSVGVVNVQPQQFRRAEEVASAAAIAKHHSKQDRVKVYCL